MALDVETLMTRMELDLGPYEAELAKLPPNTRKVFKKLESAVAKSSKELAKQQESLAIKTSKVQAKAARDATKAIEREAKERQRAEAKANREIEASYSEQFSAIKGLSSAAFGGMAGDAFDAFDALKGVSGGLALVGGALAGLAIGGVILSETVAKLYAMGDASLEARDRLAETGLALDVLFTPAQLASLTSYEEGQKELTTASDILAVTLGSELNPTLERGFTALTNLAALVVKYEGWISGAADATLIFAGSLLKNNAILTLFAIEMGIAGDELRQNITDSKAKAKADEEGAAAVKGYTAATQEEYAALAGFSDLLAGEVTPEVKANAAATRDAAAAERERIEVVNTAFKADGQHQIAVRQAREEMQSYGITVGSEVPYALQGLDEKATETGETLKKSAKEVSEDWQEFLDVMSALSTSFDALAAFAGLAVDRTAEQGAAERDELEQTREQIGELRALRQAAADEDKDQYRERIKRLQQDRKQQRRQLRGTRQDLKQRFKSMKALQMSSAIISGAAAIAAAFAPPPFGAGPVVGPVLAASVGLATAAQIATIKAQKPPKFHTGGVVGIPRQEVPAVLEAGEGVIRREAMNQPGALETLERLNEGAAPSSSAGMAVYLNDRLVDTLTARSERSTARSRRGLALAGTATLYDRRR
jgi:hypothetical protein